MDAAIDIRPTYHSFAFTASLNAVFGHVDGVGPYRLEWNRPLRIPVAPGEHVVVVWAKYLVTPTVGISHALLHLDPGRQVGVSWTMPLTIFSSGRIDCVPVGPPLGLAALEPGYIPNRTGARQLWPPHGSEPLVPFGATAPGAWQPDPSGRHQLRWWDGSRWTDAVSDGTTTSSDPI